VNSGELSPRTWAEYKTTSDLRVKHFGKQRLVSDLLNPFELVVSDLLGLEQSTAPGDSRPRHSTVDLPGISLTDLGPLGPITPPSPVPSAYFGEM
jgi:hypothetical protein